MHRILSWKKTRYSLLCWNLRLRSKPSPSCRTSTGGNYYADCWLFRNEFNVATVITTRFHLHIKLLTGRKPWNLLKNSVEVIVEARWRICGFLWAHRYVVLLSDTQQWTGIVSSLTCTVCRSRCKFVSTLSRDSITHSTPCCYFNVICCL